MPDHSRTTDNQDVAGVRLAIDDWLQGLDTGDLERMISTVDPDAVTCNEHQPTGYGIDAVREKYAPRIAGATFRSGFDIEHIQVFDGFAVIIGFFTVESTDKSTGKTGGGKGRLLLVYRKHADGWKMLVDMDNNDEKS